MDDLGSPHQSFAKTENRNSISNQKLKDFHNMEVFLFSLFLLSFKHHLSIFIHQL